MHKFALVPILLPVPVSTGALAHSGSEQDEKACAPDVHRFCRKLVDQTAQSSLPRAATCWSATDNRSVMRRLKREAGVAR
jgi:hypothetical protein